MAALIIPAVAAEVAIIETIGAPEIFAHGSVPVMVDPEVVENVYFVERVVGDLIVRHEAARIVMPRSRWLESMAAIHRRYLVTVGH